MGFSHPASFRRILLSRILLLTIPVLLLGEYVVYRRVRSGVLETARYNLAQSAARKADGIQTNIALLRTNLVASSQAYSLVATQPPQVAQTFAQQMEWWLPKTVQCLQITEVATGAVVTGNCGNLPSTVNPGRFRLTSPNGSGITPADVVLSVVPPPVSLPPASRDRPSSTLILTAPIYSTAGKLTYLLQLRTTLNLEEAGEKSALQGYTAVINQEGVILAHVKPQLVGQTIAQQPNAPVLEALVESAIAGQQDALHLFEENQSEWLAGYTAVTIPLQGAETQTWVILSLAPVNSALYDLQAIRAALIVLTLGLIGASVLVTVFVARDLATPLETLGNYARDICDRLVIQPAPNTFKVKELNQLAEALNKMVASLEDQAKELEAAWQQALVANQLKSNFLATTSHELRTPLNAIIGCVRLVKDGCCDDWEESLEFLQQADDAALHLLKIINDLLDMAKIEAGRVEINPQPLSVLDLCQQCIAMVQPSADSKNITLKVTVDPALPAIALDELRAHQMLINLLSNAVKFTPEQGKVAVNAWKGQGAELAQDQRPDQSPINPAMQYLCLEVVDSGIGIPPERQHVLFRPFQQIESPLVRAAEGTGLGLALTKLLAELHGGTVSFTSQLGQGSTFRIWIPLPTGHLGVGRKESEAGAA